jgi:hypothetical protein
MDVCFLGGTGIDHIWFNTSISEKIRSEVDTKTSILATKEDVANLKAELKADGANLKAELIKWMFVFWIGQLVAFVMLFLKK